MSIAEVLPAPVGTSRTEISAPPDIGQSCLKTCFARRFCQGKGSTPCTASKNATNSSGLSISLIGHAPDQAASTDQARGNGRHREEWALQLCQRSAELRGGADDVQTWQPAESSSREDDDRRGRGRRTVHHKPRSACA